MNLRLVALCLTLSAAAQTVPVQPAPILPMPADRTDAYLLYTKLMPVGESAGPTWPHDLFLIESATHQMVPTDQPCLPVYPDGKRHKENALNPHDAVTPPQEDQQDYIEVLADFDRHCHDRAQLDPSAWSAATAPVQLLNEQQQAEYQISRFGGPSTDKTRAAELALKYKGAPGLFTFSEPYFNSAHTVALIYSGLWCGGLCGNWIWNAFRLVNGQWTPLKWNSTVTYS